MRIFRELSRQRRREGVSSLDLRLPSCVADAWLPNFHAPQRFASRRSASAASRSFPSTGADADFVRPLPWLAQLTFCRRAHRSVTPPTLPQARDALRGRQGPPRALWGHRALSGGAPGSFAGYADSHAVSGPTSTARRIRKGLCARPACTQSLRPAQWRLHHVSRTHTPVLCSRSPRRAG